VDVVVLSFPAVRQVAQPLLPRCGNLGR
jgi:hypothetical protein